MNKIINALLVARLLLGVLAVVLAAATGVVWYKMIAQTGQQAAASPAPTATITPKVVLTPAPTVLPKTNYTGAEGLAAVKALYADGSGYTARNRHFFLDSYLNRADQLKLNYDPVLCSVDWPPTGGLGYEGPFIGADGVAAVTVAEHWTSTAGGDRRLTVYIDLNTLKITDIICPAMHLGTY